jgi:hypothetical protein
MRRKVLRAGDDTTEDPSYDFVVMLAMIGGVYLPLSGSIW